MKRSQLGVRGRNQTQSLAGKRHLLLLAGIFLITLWPSLATAQTSRLVILKLDGLPPDTVDHFVRETDPRTGKSQLPWIDHIFYDGGTRLANFYTRGISLSGPSWSMLDTGQHLQIKGNVEFDRYTLYSYDYLNLLPLFLRGAAGKQADMPGVEVLDSLGIPLMVDAYTHEESYNGFSIYLRGPRYLTLSNALQNHFKRPPKELFDEWTMGLEMGNMVNDELIKELISELRNPKVRYLDVLLQTYDHVAHHNGDRDTQLMVLKELDTVVGRIWTAIRNTPDADQTALVMVSDHGMNTDEQVYGQGFNLVKLLGSPAGGGHHVGTKRRLLMEYSIKALNPFYGLITTTSRDSYYLKGQSLDYPTALIDFDGNERAAIQLRDSDLNLLHILLQQLQRRDITPSLRQALTDAFFVTVDHRQAHWQSDLDDLKEELTALHRSIEKQDALWQQQPKKLTQEEKDLGRDDEIKRIYAQLLRWRVEEQDYSGYARVMSNLLALRRETFDPFKLRIEDVIQKDSLGEQNSIYELQNYVVGIGPNGLVLDASGALDMQRSFVRVNYFSLLQGQIVRNNVQPRVSNRPVEFVATAIPLECLPPGLGDLDRVKDSVVWVYGGEEKQALIFAREDAAGQYSLRYQPIKHLQQDPEGRISLETAAWQPGLPLEIIEDPALSIPAGKADQWLSQWHTDLEWLHAVHKTWHSNGVIGLYEALGRHVLDQGRELSGDEMLMQRFVQRQRRLIETELLVLANNHWNFDVRGFNPGGNHGSFFRTSTHSTWMMAGGSKTGIPAGSVIEEPYDSLSFTPTMLALTGKLRHDMSFAPELTRRGFRAFPGRVAWATLR